MTDWTWPDAQTTRIVDGDTLDMRVTRDLGFGGSATFVVRLRLGRINAPAAYTDEGKAATAYLTGLLPIGSTAALTTTGPYKYGGPQTSPGEWMAEITTTAGNVSDLMVAAGHAVYWDGEGPRPGDGTPATT